MNQDQPYLILHKVRGQPAFDVAVSQEIDGEQMWIVATSGHRAYPCKWWAMEDILPRFPNPYASDDEIASLPDHYSANDQYSRHHKPAIAAIAAILGLVPTVRRRRI